MSNSGSNLVCHAMTSSICHTHFLQMCVCTTRFKFELYHEWVYTTQSVSDCVWLLFFSLWFIYFVFFLGLSWKSTKIVLAFSSRETNFAIALIACFLFHHMLGVFKEYPLQDSIYLTLSLSLLLSSLSRKTCI